MIFKTFYYLFFYLYMYLDLKRMIHMLLEGSDELMFLLGNTLLLTLFFIITYLIRFHITHCLTVGFILSAVSSPRLSVVDTATPSPQCMLVLAKGHAYLCVYIQ